ncbi:hypothetical protein BU24DRAFT_417535 [Aaosphaeria arxii CBS 175.79]|uniref:Uncharacterized protein n=1 Tax=Aaosphaeria arxii CBS 175.79 TaxID=1450172 RepID=A0A6A5YAT8_9PLEO|nr:uncharacterized protein BU24DRAFT_417535 [Aaosphaeria arxii CBS 175.79]KAF2021890.1 hypothetical protein BU24DRAFT_417535 [Aaosphaeria arxii CBS 175.79]
MKESIVCYLESGKLCPYSRTVRPPNRSRKDDHGAQREAADTYAMNREGRKIIRRKRATGTP